MITTRITILILFIIFYKLKVYSQIIMLFLAMIRQHWPSLSGGLLLFTIEEFYKICLFIIAKKLHLLVRNFVRYHFYNPRFLMFGLHCLLSQELWKHLELDDKRYDKHLLSFQWYLATLFFFNNNVIRNWIKLRKNILIQKPFVQLHDTETFFLGQPEEFWAILLKWSLYYFLDDEFVNLLLSNNNSSKKPQGIFVKQYNSCSWDPG